MKPIKLPSNLGRLCISRVAEGPASTIHHCDNPEALAAYWTESVASGVDYNPDQERIVVILLNTRLRPIGWHLIALGTCNECLARVADILRPSVVCSCFGFAVMHNHPSGDVTPSEADRTLTRRLSEASALMGIRFVDHVITTEPSRLAAGDPPFFSFRGSGLIC